MQPPNPNPNPNPDPNPEPNPMPDQVKEETSLRLAHAESPSWRSRLEAVKSQMEDSSLKVELAEQEMRRAVGEMKQEQRLNSAQACHATQASNQGLADRTQGGS